MKTITSMLVVIVFLYIVYKRRISPLVNKGKKPVSNIKDSASNSVQGSILPSYPGNVPVIPLTSAMLDSSYRYDVMVFDLLKYDETTYFADRVEAAINLTISEMIDKGYTYRFDFITIGTALLVLVTYRIDSNNDIKSKVSTDTNT